MTEDAEYGKTVEALKDVERRKKEQFDVNVKEIIKEVVSSFCLLITKNAVSEEPIQNSSNDHLIPDESERATEVLRKNVKCLEQLLHYSLDFHLKQAVKQLETLSLSWEKVVLEGGFEDNKHIIENKYDEILVLFRKSA
uniref:Uncharacterized protein n=1 Tax=Caenorhabditis japonica TaxID=281687 RepID=A0A8R1HTR2_CAEJA